MHDSVCSDEQASIRHIGIMDIGSNSARYMIAKLYANRTFHMLDQGKETIRLGAGYDEEGSIPNQKVDELLSVIHRFKQLGENYQRCEWIAVTTAAMRKAANSEYIVRRIYEETGITVQMISGDSEAYLDYVAVLSTVDVQDAVIMDMGGGSTEFIWMENRQFKESISLPVGALTIAEDYEVENALTADTETYLRSMTRYWLRHVHWLKEAQGLPLVAIGGTLRTLAKMDIDEREYGVDSLHHYEFMPEEVEDWHQRIKGMDLEEKQALPGLSKDRAAILTGSLTFINECLLRFDSSKVMVSAKGVREGVLFDMLRGEGIHIDHPLKFSIYHLQHRLGLNRIQADRLWQLTNALMQELQPILGWEEEWKRIVYAAAQLHDIGVSVSHMERERHTFYMIRHAELYGLTPRQIALSALVATMDFKHKVPREWAEVEAILQPRDQTMAAKMGLIMRLALDLTRTYGCQTAEDVSCTVKDGEIILMLQGAAAHMSWRGTDMYALRAGFRRWLKRELKLS
ncbi:Ppx/GppA family phosphatase [Paenibacillus sp. SC116]|uniref:Ppx/GppA phosphatase family protein n=1 Tax=Paenibacillus sp. SC116 TaxID=2968986 RepID=UPI00215B74D7|nr:Ppx/GppA phosphatase family protein [Paenibacillus sp. SC116]MCR8846133.1 Ppx/GppA family phosphatase [Paenibacillus sp. SC116]